MLPLALAVICLALLGTVPLAQEPAGALANGKPRGTRLESGGRLIFQADANVSFGATYGESAVKATVTAVHATRLAMRTERTPQNVFRAGERVPQSSWRYETDTQLVYLDVPAGRTELQFRFDDLDSLDPFEAPVDLILCDRDWKPTAPAVKLSAQCREDHFRCSHVWAAAQGYYAVRAWAGDSPCPPSAFALAVDRAAADIEQAGRVLLMQDSTLSLDGALRGRRPAVSRLELKLDTGIAAMRQLSKQKVFATPGSLLAEGESFDGEGGGAIKTSTEHQNTHGGGCIWAWSTPGHWLRWSISVPTAGRYSLVAIGATAEAIALRSLRIDERPVPGAELLAFTSTGGWGRLDPEQWQAFQPVGADGTPIAFRLRAGEHQLRLENVSGQHLNIDCLVLTPVGR